MSDEKKFKTVDYFCNWLSIFVYIVVAIAYFFPPPRSLAYEHPWIVLPLMLVGPLGTWAAVSDIRRNREKRKQDEVSE